VADRPPHRWPFIVRGGVHLIDAGFAAWLRVNYGFHGGVGVSVGNDSEALVLDDLVIRRFEGAHERLNGEEEVDRGLPEFLAARAPA
jgi:hypothetical protein